MEIDKEICARVGALVRDSKRVAVLTHMAPDGDAMGSALAVCHWLRSEGKEAAVVVPNAFPDFLRWMPGAEEIHVYEQDAETCKRVIAEADLLFCTDFNEPTRIGKPGELLLAKQCPKILVDHHLHPEDFADVTISDPHSPSASELIYRLLVGLGVRIDETLATCIYTGMMTDTGNFSFNSTYPDMYEIVAELVRAGVKKDEVYNAVFNQYSADRMRLVGYALYKKMQILPGHVALITLSADELERYNYRVGDTEGLVNMPLQITDVYYSVFMREERAKPGTPKSRIRISFRSQGDRPVNILAHDVFNGGGHMNAAGGELFGTLGQAVRLFIREYEKYVK